MAGREQIFSNHKDLMYKLCVEFAFERIYAEGLFNVISKIFPEFYTSKFECSLPECCLTLYNDAQVRAKPSVFLKSERKLQ